MPRRLLGNCGEIVDLNTGATLTAERAIMEKTILAVKGDCTGHYAVCPIMFVHCAFSGQGCTYVGQRRELAEHYTQHQDHHNRLLLKHVSENAEAAEKKACESAEWERDISITFNVPLAKLNRGSGPVDIKSRPVSVAGYCVYIRVQSESLQSPVRASLCVEDTNPYRGPFHTDEGPTFKNAEIWVNATGELDWPPRNGSIMEEDNGGLCWDACFLCEEPADDIHHILRRHPDRIREFSSAVKADGSLGGFLSVSRYINVPADIEAILEDGGDCPEVETTEMTLAELCQCSETGRSTTTTEIVPICAGFDMKKARSFVCECEEETRGWGE
jgi:hypothetical protein